MSDVSKITVGNSTYDIKDADARQVLDALGTAATKDSTNSVTTGSTDLVESGAVKTAIDAAVSSAYHAAGPKTVAELTSSLLIEANEGNVYNMTTSGVTSSDFVEGYGYPIRIGDNVGICKIDNAYKFDLLSGFVDLTNYVQKSATSGLLKNDGSVDTAITGAVSANTTAISGIKDGTSIDSFGDVETALADKVDKVTGKGLSTNDYTDEDKEKVDKIDVSSTSVSGNPLSFTTKSAQLANNAEIVLEPIQAGSGDPSPSNVRAISGYNKVTLLSSRKNLFNKYSEQDTRYASATINGELITVTGTYFCLFKFDYILPPETYTMSGRIVSSTSATGFRLYYTDNTYSNMFTVNETVNTNGHFVNGIMIYSGSSNSGTALYENLQLELGSTATTYEPYNPATDITLKLNETVYGGKLNVRTGELVVDRGIVDLEDLEWTVPKSENPTITSSTGLVGLVKHVKNSEVSNIICTKYLSVSRDAIASLDGYLIAINSSETTLIKDSNFTGKTSSQIKEYLTGVKLVYKLATPYTIQLTPHEISLLLGANVVTTNGTTINLTYNANGEIASLDDLSGVGESINALSDVVATLDTQLQLVTNNDLVDITSRLSDLPAAIAEQNLEKYGYKIGQYFTGASGYNYFIADLDPFFGGYNSYATITSHHVGIVVDTKTASKWNETADISSVNYKDSTLHTFLSTTVLDNIKSDLTALFGSWENHLIAHDKLYAKLGGWGWSSTNTRSEYISALTECQMYGSPIWSADNYQQGEGSRQLELFRRHTWMRVFGNTSIWLRSISTASNACNADYNGGAYDNTVTDSRRAAGLILFK